MKAEQEQQKNAAGSDHRETPTPPPVPPPTPSPQSSRSTSSLLSPWWSAEATEPEQKPAKGHHLLMHFTRIVNGSTTAADSNAPLFTEQCVLLTRQDRSSSSSAEHSTTPAASSTHFLNGNQQSDCRMVCMLRENDQRRKAQRQAHGSFLNPFHGLWIVVATTQARCLEHSAEKDITKKNHADYYTINLGERFSGSGDDVKRFLGKLFSPTQELTRRYIQSWEDGTQSVFLSKFWESARRGDAFGLVRDSTRRLFKMASGGDKDGDGKGDRS